MANRTAHKSATSRTRQDATTNQPSPIGTAGESFPGGASIELISDSKTGRLLLLFTDEQNCSIAPHIQYGGRTYLPINLDARALKAVRFPHEVGDYETTRKLFMANRQVFMEYGFPKEAAQVGTHFDFSTWFPDCLPAAPCLLINGPRPEAELFFQLLACLVRRPLQLADFNPKSLSSLMEIQPTLLIGQEHLSPSKLRLLLASNNPHSFVPLGDGLASFYSAKAIYRGIPFSEDSLGNTMLRINLTPIRGKLPILDSKTQEEIAREFQPKLLKYRTRNIDIVRESSCDFPWLTSGGRILARILGACITDDPELQSELAPFFQRQQQAIREQNWLDSRCVTIEVGLAFCHSVQKDRLVHVREFADDANTIMKFRGDTKTLEPKEMGNILRSLGFSPKRDRRGYAIRFTDEVRRQIHRLAYEYDVAAVVEGKPRCQHCSEVQKAGSTGNASASEDRDSPNRY